MFGTFFGSYSRWCGCPWRTSLEEAPHKQILRALIISWSVGKWEHPANAALYERPGFTAIEIEPTVRHGADLGYLPGVIADACGAGNEEEAARSLDLLRFAGDTILTDTATISRLLRRASSGSVSG